LRSEDLKRLNIITFESGPMNNNTYLAACRETGEALVIDPAGDVREVAEEAKQRGFSIRMIVNTHGHYDHTDGNAELKSLTGAEVVMHRLAAQKTGGADRAVEDGDLLKVGRISFRVIYTPGHTPGGICLYGEGQLFTGDTLFVGDSGRTDLSGGDRPTLGASIRRLMELPGDTVVRPGHNIGPKPVSTLDWEKRHNVNAVEYGYFEETGL